MDIEGDWREEIITADLKIQRPSGAPSLDVPRLFHDRQYRIQSVTGRWMSGYPQQAIPSKPVQLLKQKTVVRISQFSSPHEKLEVVYHINGKRSFHSNQSGLGKLPVGLRRARLQR